MNNTSIESFIEEKLNHYAQQIVDRSERADEMALGELTFYIALRRVINGNGTLQDLGLMDAINDTLQEKGLLEKGQTFYK